MKPTFDETKVIYLSETKYGSMVFSPICRLVGVIIGNATTRMHTIFDGKDIYTATHSLLSVQYNSASEKALPFALFCTVSLFHLSHDMQLTIMYRKRRFRLSFVNLFLFHV